MNYIGWFEVIPGQKPIFRKLLLDFIVFNIYPCEVQICSFCACCTIFLQLVCCEQGHQVEKMSEQCLWVWGNNWTPPGYLLDNDFSHFEASKRHFCCDKLNMAIVDVDRTSLVASCGFFHYVCGIVYMCNHFVGNGTQNFFSGKNVFLILHSFSFIW